MRTVCYDSGDVYGGSVTSQDPSLKSLAQPESHDQVAWKMMGNCRQVAAINMTCGDSWSFLHCWSNNSFNVLNCNYSNLFYKFHFGSFRNQRKSKRCAQQMLEM